MLKYLIKKIIKDPDNVTDPAVRTSYGTLCGIYGIVLNLLLFFGKLFAGTVAGSVAITADAFNNLSDAGSSIITLLGFTLASRHADSKHPFGHGRMEYFAGLILSLLIVFIGFELGFNSLHKIRSPEPVTPGILSISILIISIALKLYMAWYNHSIGKKIHSEAMKTTSLDSLSDSLATFVVLLSMLFTLLTGINIDGWAGLIVALFIVYVGISSAYHTISPLLGEAPNEELVEGIRQIVLSHEAVFGVHDLIVHDYGPDRLVVSLHAEVDGRQDLFTAHSIIDDIEDDIRAQYNCITTIHLDPVNPEDSETKLLEEQVEEELRQELSSGIKIHDFRVEKAEDRTVFHFDVVVPDSLKMEDVKISEKIDSIIASHHPGYSDKVTIDR